jgi:hypothetical protein
MADKRAMPRELLEGGMSHLEDIDTVYETLSHLPKGIYTGKSRLLKNDIPPSHSNAMGELMAYRAKFISDMMAIMHRYMIDTDFSRPDT